jgi:hypothetical protein
MLWQIFLVVLAALFAYKFLGDMRRAWVEHRALCKLVYECYTLPNGSILRGFAITDYDTGDTILWSKDGNVEWRFAQRDGIESPRTWRIVGKDIADFFSTVMNVELRQAEAEKLAKQ